MKADRGALRHIIYEFIANHDIFFNQTSHCRISNRGMHGLKFPGSGLHILHTPSVPN